MSNIVTFHVGEREYQAIPLDAFTTNSYLIKFKSIFSGLLSSGMDTNAMSLMSIIDDSTLEKLVFPIFAQCNVVCTSEGKKLQNKQDLNALFSADTLDEFYAVIWEVLKMNFGPFICKMVKNLTGRELSDLVAVMKEKMKKSDLLSSAPNLNQKAGSGDQS